VSKPRLNTAQGLKILLEVTIRLTCSTERVSACRCVKAFPVGSTCFVPHYHRRNYYLQREYGAISHTIRKEEGYMSQPCTLSLVRRIHKSNPVQPPSMKEVRSANRTSASPWSIHFPPCPVPWTVATLTSLYLLNITYVRTTMLTCVGSPVENYNARFWRGVSEPTHSNPCKVAWGKLRMLVEHAQ
jgi:hypothetical protein